MDTSTVTWMSVAIVVTVLLVAGTVLLVLRRRRRTHKASSRDHGPHRAARPKNGGHATPADVAAMTVEAEQLATTMREQRKKPSGLPDELDNEWELLDTAHRKPPHDDLHQDKHGTTDRGPDGGPQQ